MHQRGGLGVFRIESALASAGNIIREYAVFLRKTLCCWLQKGLICLRLRTRGAIALGRLHHGQNFVVGEGLVNAYLLEKHAAWHPRVVIEDEVIEILLSEPIPNVAVFENRIAHTIKVDEDGLHFVDYLGADVMTGDPFLPKEFMNVRQETKDDLAAAKDNPDLFSKLQWLDRYVEASIDRLIHQDQNLRTNTGSRFGEKFPRTGENLKTFLENVRDDVMQGPELESQSGSV